MFRNNVDTKKHGQGHCPDAGQSYASWQLVTRPEFCSECGDSDHKTTAAEDVMISRLMNEEVAKNTRYKVYTTSGQSRHPSWNGSDLARWFCCTASKSCKVQYQVRRLNSHLAIYRKGQHKHVLDAKLESGNGLSNLAKQRISELGVEKDYGSVLVKKIVAGFYPSEEVPLITKGLSMDDALDRAKFKRQITQYMTRQKRKKSR